VANNRLDSAALDEPQMNTDLHRSISSYLCSSVWIRGQ